jgi:hypothetical protein
MATKTYKNKLNQPLPVTLNSKSLSVGAKGSFDVEEYDWGSPDLARLLGKRFIKLEGVEGVVPEKPVAKSAPAVKPKATGTDESASAPVLVGSDKQGTDEKPDAEAEKVDDKDGDSLTNGSEKVELDKEDAVPAKPKHGGPKRMKKKRQYSDEGSNETASREKARS